MIRPRFLLALLLSASSTALLPADLPQRWRSWRYSRAVQAPPSQDSLRSEIALPWDLFARCLPNCADVRLIDDRGQEVPFDLRADRDEFHSETHPTKLVENSFVRGEYTQIIADAGEDPSVYDRVSIDTPRPDFIVWAELALSDDARAWRVVEPRAPIARFRSRSVDGTQTIPFQGLYSRYLRIRIFEPAAQFPVDAVKVLHEVSRKAERIEIPSSFIPSAPSAEGESSWTADLRSAAYPISQFRFATDTGEFYRAVRISGSNDGKEWMFLASGTIYRYSQGKVLRESLAIAFPEWAGPRFLRVTVVNENDAPLSSVRVSVFGIPRKLLFRQDSGRQYRVLYGNDRAPAPKYDIHLYLENKPADGLLRVLGLGPEELTSNYLDPRPFTERHPALLLIVLAIAVLLLGYAALRALRTAPELKSPS